MDNETWKPIHGYEGYYSVSDLGNVKSLFRKVNSHQNIIYTFQERNLIKHLNCQGYACVKLNKCNKSKSFKVHRLVAEAFIPNPENKATVNHKNGIRNDNRVENLEWATHRENVIHSYIKLNRPRTVGRKGALSSQAIPVNQLTISGKFIKRFNSMSDAVREVGVDRKTMYKCILGQFKMAKGFKWEIA